MKRYKRYKRYKSNSINKSNKISTKEIPENPTSESKVNPIVTVTFVTNVTDARSIKDKIKCVLFVEPEKTVKEIAEYLKDDSSNIKTTLQRDKEIFKIVSKIGKENVYSLSEKEREILNKTSQKS